MRRFVALAASLVASLLSVAPVLAQSRVALVIGNSAYQGAPPLKTTIADAGLVAATLQAAGYDVTAINDLNKESIGPTIGAFRDKLVAAGPGAVAFVYFAGYGAQLNADSYLVPVDAQIASADAVANEALPLSALIETLTAVPAAARILVLDASRDHGFGKASGQPVAPGLALVGAPPGTLIAYASAPGTVAPDGNGPNSPFTSALVTLMRQPGLDIEQILKGVRLQVNEASKGTQTPWMASALGVEVKLFDAPAPAAAASSAPAVAAAKPQTLAPALGVAGLRVPPTRKRRVTKTSMRQMSAEEAYRTAVEDDALEDYQWFVETHPDYPLAGQVWDTINNRREAILWHRTLTLGTTSAYWNYMNRYPNGSHSWSARNWLFSRGQPLPPPNYVATPDYLPPGYYDEAVGLADIVPSGYAPPPRVFDDLAPIYVPLRPWQRQQPIVITVRPQPSLPLPTPAVNPTALITPRVDPLPVQQPVPAIAVPATASTETAQQKADKAAAIQMWHDNIKRQNEALAQKFKTPVVAVPSGPLTPQPANVSPASTGPQPIIINAPPTAQQQKLMDELQQRLREDARRNPPATTPGQPNGSGASVSSAISADEPAGKPNAKPGAPPARVAPAIPPQRVVNQPPAGQLGAPATVPVPGVRPAPTLPSNAPVIPPAGRPASAPAIPAVPPQRIVNQPPAGQLGAPAIPGARPAGAPVIPNAPQSPAVRPAGVPAIPAVPQQRIVNQPPAGQPGVPVVPPRPAPTIQSNAPAIPAGRPAGAPVVPNAPQPPAIRPAGVPTTPTVPQQRIVNQPPANHPGQPANQQNPTLRPAQPNVPVVPPAAHPANAPPIPAAPPPRVVNQPPVNHPAPVAVPQNPALHPAPVVHPNPAAVPPAPPPRVVNQPPANHPSPAAPQAPAQHPAAAIHSNAPAVTPKLPQRPAPDAPPRPINQPPAHSQPPAAAPARAPQPSQNELQQRQNHERELQQREMQQRQTLQHQQQQNQNRERELQQNRQHELQQRELQQRQTLQHQQQQQQQQNQNREREIQQNRQREMQQREMQQRQTQQRQEQPHPQAAPQPRPQPPQQHPQGAQAPACPAGTHPVNGQCAH